MNSRFWRYGLGLLTLVILLAAAVTVGWKAANHRDYIEEHNYPLLDPSVGDPDVRQEIINFDPLRQNLNTYLAGISYSHSFYFEYLPNGANIRDGADEASIAASLMKTPVVMDLYKQAEAGNLSLDQIITVKQNDLSNDLLYGNPTQLKAGDTISLRKAAQITLKQSDNTTLNIVKNKVLPLLNDETDAIQSLDITYNITGNNLGNEQVNISAGSYASILKCLYYACFLNPVDSQTILDQLSGSAEHGRIMAGVPPGIRVAHKVGSSLPAQSDCGIVYYPGKPYLMCLMFFGSSVTDTGTDTYFKHVSQELYRYVSSSGKDF